MHTIPFHQQQQQQEPQNNDLSNVNHFDAIPYWTMEKCIRFLESSVTKHKEKIQLPVNDQQLKPAAVRRAIAKRLNELVEAQVEALMTLKQQVVRYEQLNQIQTDLINDQAFVIQQLNPSSSSRNGGTCTSGNSPSSNHFHLGRTAPKCTLQTERHSSLDKESSSLVRGKHNLSIRPISNSPRR